MEALFNVHVSAEASVLMAENTLPDILSGNTTHAGCPAELSLHKSVEC